MEKVSLKSLATNGVLRVGLNLGNHALVQHKDGAFYGKAPDLARRIADGIGTQIEFISYTSARELAENIGNVWDIGFLGNTPSRRATIAFTDPYLTIEASLAVRTKNATNKWQDFNKTSSVILGVKGAAYESFLRMKFDKSDIQFEANTDAAMKRFVIGEGNALAGVRESLLASISEKSSDELSVLIEPFGKIDQCIGVSMDKEYLVPEVNSVIEIYKQRSLFI